MIAANVLLSLAKAVIFIYTLLTFPVYAIYYKCIKRARRGEPYKARVVSTGTNEITYRAIPYSTRFTEEMIRHPDNINTMEKVARWVVAKYGKRPCLGTRTLLKEEKTEAPDGKIFTKLILGEYKWSRYVDLDSQSDHFARGLLELGIKPRERVCIFADTRAEWLVSAWGCWKTSVAIATIYTNLGDDGIEYGINQTQASTVITSSSLYPKLSGVLSKLPHVKNVIYFEHPLKKDPITSDAHSVISYSQMLAVGGQSKQALSHPNPEDTAIIMYTSGSTGNPKGVIITHANMVSALQSILTLTSQALEVNRSIDETDAYISFLPLAHVLEMLAEHVMLCVGVKLGYSNPGTLTDKSTMIRPGDQGDCSVLRPTCMAAVPLIVDRVYKGILNSISEKSQFAQMLVSYSVEYRRSWVRRGYDTPIMNRLIFGKMKAVVGGRMGLMLSGGAPLSPDAQRFIGTCLGVTMLQGYGLTETTSTACIVDPNDKDSVGHVGPPLMGVDLRIADWDEGGYTVKDKQGPRGEIMIGGAHVAAGYFLMEEKTKEDFFDEGGVRYFRTGDIGQVLDGGRVKIIDRKKDLVKLQAGEYVSLGKVEANLKVHPLVENVCVYAHANHSATLAIVVPDEKKLESLADEMGKQGRQREELCADKAVCQKVLALLTKHGVAARLEKFEIPKALVLSSEPWTPESGLVTAAFKLKRKPLQVRFQKEIDQMYYELENKGSVAVNLEKPAPGKTNKVGVITA